MEILIIGIIIVALMAYVSTRIKRSAAAAFQAETVETDEYSIQKPDGFLSVIGGDPRFAFEAYSKDFGTGQAEKLRQVRATLVIDPDQRDGDEEIVATRTEVIDSDVYKLTEAKASLAGTEVVVLRNTVEKNGRRYLLEVTRLAETSEDVARKTEEFVESLRLK